MRSVRLLAIAGFVTLVAAVLAAGHATAADEPKLTQQEIEKIVHDYLLANPEVVGEALRRLQQRQSASAAMRSKQALHDHRQPPPARQTSPVEGKAQGTCPIVAFFDY